LQRPGRHDAAEPGEHRPPPGHGLPAGRRVPEHRVQVRDLARRRLVAASPVRAGRRAGPRAPGCTAPARPIAGVAPGPPGRPDAAALSPTETAGRTHPDPPSDTEDRPFLTVGGARSTPTVGGARSTIRITGVFSQKAPRICLIFVGRGSIRNP